MVLKNNIYIGLMKKIIILYIFVLPFLGFGQDSIAEDKSLIKIAESITSIELKNHLTIFASDSFEGRETGEKGQKLAANYIANVFQENNIIPVGDEGTYFQKFKMYKKKYNTIAISSNGKQFVNNKDFLYLKRNYQPYSLENKEVLLITNNVQIAENDLNNKIAIVTMLEHIPLAYQKGAVFVFFVSEIKHLNISNDMIHYLEQDKLFFNNEKPNFDSYIIINTSMAASILNVSEKKLKTIAPKKPTQNKEISLKSTLSLTIDVSQKFIETENVCGLIEGTTKKDELIVISAHYDHIGIDGDVIYNGADDDGTGTVAILELAQAFSLAQKMNLYNQRSILFMCMTGEEKGLLGSEYYTNNPIFPLEKTMANLNIDMIGRLDEFHKKDSNYVYIIGSNMISNDLHTVNETANATYTKLQLDYRFNSKDNPEQYYYRSDHYNFAKNDIPVIFYFTGVHEDYHKPTDTVDKIMFGKTKKITQLIFYTAYELANRKEQLRKNEVR